MTTSSCYANTKRHITKATRPLRWLVPPITLGLAIPVVIEGHHLFAQTRQTDPYCPSSLYGCGNYSWLPNWEAWTMSVAFGLLLFTLCAMSIAGYRLPSTFLRTSPGRLLRRLVSRRDDGDNLLGRALSIETFAEPIGLYAVFAAIALVAGSLLADFVMYVVMGI